MLTLSLGHYLFAVLLLVLYVVIWRIYIKPKSRKRIAIHATATSGMDRPPALMDRFVRRIVRTTSKRIGKYIPGSIGLSAVSKAIMKDFGTILDRATRKYYAKQYSLPRLIYV